jgi:hypothetical protein
MFPIEVPTRSLSSPKLRPRQSVCKTNGTAKTPVNEAARPSLSAQEFQWSVGAHQTPRAPNSPVDVPLFPSVFLKSPRSVFFNLYIFLYVTFQLMRERPAARTQIGSRASLDCCFCKYKKKITVNFLDSTILKFCLTCAANNIRPPYSSCISAY